MAMKYFLEPSHKENYRTGAEPRSNQTSFCSVSPCLRGEKRLGNTVMLWLLMGSSLMSAGCSNNSDPKSESPAAGEKSSATEKSPTEISLRVGGADELQAVLDSHRGKVVLVDFWATWCAPCRKQFPHTVELNRQHAADGFAAISVSCDEADREEEIMAFLKKTGATFDNLRSKHGGDEETFSAFAIEGGALPHYKLYDRTGKLRHTFGADPTAEKQFTSEDIDIKVKELLAEKSPEQ